jgi:alpha-glucosidase (family GH31 glycosyl hydrolase)
MSHCRHRQEIVVLFAVLFFSRTTAQIYPGDVTGITQTDRSVTLRAGEFSVRFMLYGPQVLRVDLLYGQTATPESSFVVIRDTTEALSITVEETDSTVSITSGLLRVLCTKSPLRIAYFDDVKSKFLLAEPASGGFGVSPPYPFATFALQPDDHFYGTGERGIGLDLRGQAFYSYNAPTFGYDTPQPTMSINVPLLASSRGYAIYFENTYQGWYDLGATNPSQFSYTSEGGQISYYLMMGTIPEQLEHYIWLTGHQPLPPRWAFGYIQSKYGYQNETEARAMVETMRQKQIPCDAIVLDLYWFHQMGDLSWNLSSWPDPRQMMADFLAQGIKTIVITEPYITENSFNYSTAVSNAFLAFNNRREPYVLPNWWSCGCNAGLLDITNPAARSWWWSLHPSFFGDNLAGIWTDLGEPELHPLDAFHYLGPAGKIHNIYNFLWAQTIFEGFDNFRPNRRLFNLTRSGYAGIQRYAVIPWSGDVGRSFGGLAVQLPMLLNMGMSGLAYHNSDIGGFCCGTTTPELFVRWMQYGVFCPITRAHGVGQGTEPWAYGQETEDIVRKYISTRYQLIPYLYTMAYQNYTRGIPLARPLLFEDPDDPRLIDESSSYMLGDNLLVSPVVEAGQTQKTLYLPRGKWIDYWTGHPYPGGQDVTVPTPLPTVPVFIRAGSIIPMQPVMNYSNEHPLDTLVLSVYPSPDQSGNFTLYEDDGQTLEYQSGSYAITDLSNRLTAASGGSNLEIDISPAVGSYSGKTQQRTYISHITGVSESPAAVTNSGISLTERMSYTDLCNNGDGYFFDRHAQMLYVQITTSPDSSYQIAVQNILLEVSDTPIEMISDFRLEQNYPNPFNPTTTIRYAIPAGAYNYTSLRVFDLLGREVATLVHGEQAPGTYSLVFDADRSGPHPLASGMYVYRLEVGGRMESRKMIVVR